MQRAVEICSTVGCSEIIVRTNHALHHTSARCLLLGALLPLLCAGCSASEDDPDLSYTVPLQRGAYWPKFRRTPDNRGWSPVMPRHGQSQVWSFATGKGIFSSPVIDREGTIYFGSADAFFYAVRTDGTLKWKKQFGELVDSSALIGDDGTIYVGSGDGHLYALDPAGNERWRFRPKGGAFITWFEGNVALGPDGTLYAGNDDFHLYAVDRATGVERWRLRGTDQVWSSAGLGPDGTLYYGANDLQLRAVDTAAAAARPAQAEQAVRWKAATLGSVVSSPLVTRSGSVVAGSFDGYLRGLAVADGQELWKVPAREHVYASAAQAPDGTLYLPSADGTLYALTEDGKLKWTFDTLEPIRSSPAVGGDGTIYFGGGDGRLYAVNPDGTRRWSFDTSVDDRNDLNASPALGRDAIYITGEDGKLWSIPYDHCLRASDKRCDTRPGGDLPALGAQVLFLSPGGSSDFAVEHTLRAGDAIALRLVVRAAGAMVDAAIDPESLQVTLTPAVPHDVQVAADGSFLAIVPRDLLPAGSALAAHVAGNYLVDGFRLGNMVRGGTVGGRFDAAHRFTVAAAALAAPPLASGADEVPVLDLQRLAVPQPVMLPSFNQIGFDFMHLLVGIIELDSTTGRALAWVAAAKPKGAEIVVDTGADQKILFPLVGRISGDGFVLDTASFRVEFGGVDVPIDRLRIGGTLAADRSSVGGLSLFGATTCANVEYYGPLLRIAGLCNPKTDQLVLLGTALLRPATFGGRRPGGLSALPPILTEATEKQDGSVTVKLDGLLPSADHVIGLLLLDTTTNRPYAVNYSQHTRNELDGSGRISGVTLTLQAAEGVRAGRTEVIVLHDFFPLGRFRL